MKRGGLTLLGFLTVQLAFSQQTDKILPLLFEGNEAYNKGEYNKALANYNRVLEIEHENNIAAFNKGNALFKNQQYDEAGKIFEEALQYVTDAEVRGKLWYNNGVALSMQKKLEESIDAYKQALRINPDDVKARENLQRAMVELKKREQQQKQPNQEQKPQPPKAEQKKMQELLKALEEQEKKLQEKKLQRNSGPSKEENDW